VTNVVLQGLEWLFNPETKIRRAERRQRLAAPQPHTS
jgi:hypothetical protein